MESSILKLLVNLKNAITADQDLLRNELQMDLDLLKREQMNDGTN